MMVAGEVEISTIPNILIYFMFLELFFFWKTIILDFTDFYLSQWIVFENCFSFIFNRYLELG